MPTLQSPSGNNLSTIPWRRSNVKHVNNELYVDLIEVVDAIFAPSGRPLAAKVHGSIVFNSKISGIPDLLLTLQSPGGGFGNKGVSTLEFPCFHPCVRLSRWREHPGELSFVPPDGKFVLATYEADLLPSKNTSTSQLHLPISVELQTLLGEYQSEFEVRLFVNPSVLSSPSTLSSSNSSHSTHPFPRTGGGRFGTSSPGFGGSSNNPVLEDVTITIPLPPNVKTLTNTRASKGELQYEPGGVVIWKITSQHLTSGFNATFKAEVLLKRSPFDDDDDDKEEDDELEDRDGYQEANSAQKQVKEKKQKVLTAVQAGMPRCVLGGFSVKGWLASGLKVDSLKVVGGRGLGEGVKPYKGVKYITKAGSLEYRN